MVLWKKKITCAKQIQLKMKWEKILHEAQRKTELTWFLAQADR